MIELKNRDSEVKNSEIKKEYHKYIPPKSHPWWKKRYSNINIGAFKKRNISFWHSIT